MTYTEPRNPLTGKGDRHVTASALTVLGLSKSIIIEPETKTEVKTSIYASSTLSDLTNKWVKTIDGNNYISWKAYLTPKTANKIDSSVALIIMAEKLKSKDWLIYYTIQWADENDWWNAHNFDIVNATSKKDAEQKIEDLKSKARINDYLLIQNQKSVASIEKLLKTEA